MNKKETKKEPKEWLKQSLELVDEDIKNMRQQKTKYATDTRINGSIYYKYQTGTQKNENKT